MASIGKCTELCLTDLQHRTLGFNYASELTADQGTEKLRPELNQRGVSEYIIETNCIKSGCCIIKKKKKSFLAANLILTCD